MERIVIHEIEGGLSDFLDFLDEKSEELEQQGVEVDPHFKTDSETLGAEVVQIILTATATLVPLLIKIWEAYNDNKKSKQPKGIRIEYEKNGEKIIIEATTVEQLKQIQHQLEQTDK